MLPAVASSVPPSMGSAKDTSDLPMKPSVDPPVVELTRPFNADVRFGAAPAIRNSNVSVRAKTSIISPRGGFLFRGTDGKSRTRLFEVEDRLVRPHSSRQQTRHPLEAVRLNPTHVAQSWKPTLNPTLNPETSRWSNLKGVYTELVAATNRDSVEELVGALTRADAQGASDQWKEVQAAKNRLSMLRSLRAELQNLLTSTSIESIELAVNKAEALRVGDTFRYLLRLKERMASLKKLRVRLEEASKGDDISGLRGCITEGLLLNVMEWPEYIAASDRHEELRGLQDDLLIALAGTSPNELTEAIQATEEAGIEGHNWSYLKLVKSRLRTMTDEVEDRKMHSALQENLSSVATRLRNELETMQIQHGMSEVFFKKRMSAGTPGVEDSASPSVDSMDRDSSSGFDSHLSSEDGGAKGALPVPDETPSVPLTQFAAELSTKSVDSDFDPNFYKSITRKPSLGHVLSLNPDGESEVMANLEDEALEKSDPYSSTDAEIRPSLLERRASAGIKEMTVDTRRLSIEASATQSSWRAVEHGELSGGRRRPSAIKADKEAMEAVRQKRSSVITFSPKQPQTHSWTTDDTSPRRPSVSSAFDREDRLSPRTSLARRPSMPASVINGTRRPSLLEGAMTKSTRRPSQASEHLRRQSQASGSSSFNQAKLDSVLDAAKSMDKAMADAVLDAAKSMDQAMALKDDDLLPRSRESKGRNVSISTNPLANTQNLLIQTRLEAVQNPNTSPSIDRF